jgi:hypothetical protein
MKNAVFWDTQTKFVPHRKHITAPLHSPVGSCNASVVVSTAVTMKNDVFWHVPLCGSCKNRRFGGTHRRHHQGDKNRRARTLVVSRNRRML